MKSPRRAILALATLVILAACEAPAASGTATPTAAATAPPAPTAAATPGPYRYTLVYDEYLGAARPLAVRAVSLNGGVPRTLAVVAPQHDGIFALQPQGTALAILDKLDHHQEHTASWRLRLLDLGSGAERDVITERTDPELVRAWDVGWTPNGKLLLATRQSLDVVDERTGGRTPIQRFPADTIGVTFRDGAHPGLLVSQTVDTYTVYDVRDDGVRAVAERPLVGFTNYARRPGTDEILELVSRFDGQVTTSLLSPSGKTEWSVKGPAVEGVVDLVGTTVGAAYVLWPIAKSDPLAFGVEGSALILRLGYDGAVEPVAGVRNWGELGPKGVSPDGRALLVPAGDHADANQHFALAVCCERRPPWELFGFGDRDVIGWIPEP